MNTVVYINAKKLTSIAGNRLKRTLDEAIDNSEESSSAIANGSAYDINETADKSSISSNFHDDDSTSTISEQIGHSPLTYSVLKKRIVEKADEIHSIVCCWFGFDVEQLRRISILITLVKAIIPIKSGYLVSSLFFFAINGNLIRVKKVETVPKDSTIEKSSLYSSNKHVIGFKTGIRFIFDYKESEFDIGVKMATWFSLLLKRRREMWYDPDQRANTASEATKVELGTKAKRMMFHFGQCEGKYRPPHKNSNVVWLNSIVMLLQKNVLKIVIH
ncbi:hypothetical protein EDC96DRAFT_562112 [Choanephora cucurbitarum]|nr:hypothetical protein EDC96DRAFT_562112 [Choanephora cucurbitarum]